MTLLNQVSINKVTTEISKTNFSLSDFEISFPKKGETLVSLRFKYRDNYYFEVIERTITPKIETKGKNYWDKDTIEKGEPYTQIYAVVSPAKYKANEWVKVSDFEQAIYQIRHWCGFIVNELSTRNNLEDSFEDIRKTFDDQFEKYNTDGDERFSNEELEELQEKFQELVQKFEKLEEENHITKEELSNLKEEFNRFESNARLYPKGIWAKMTNNKFVDLIVGIAKSKEGRSFILEEIKKLIYQT